MAPAKKITWYRCKVDKKLMSALMEQSDLKGLRQTVPQLLLFVATSALSYYTLLQISRENWMWMLPAFLIVFFIHGTFSSFLGLTGPCHELCHKTPFKTKWLNEFFLKVYSFLSWTDYVAFRPSHVLHHQVTVHHDLDGEVVLPMRISVSDWKFWLWAFGFNFIGVWNTVRDRFRDAITGEISFEWSRKMLPETNAKGRREQTNWMRMMVVGHLLLATIFIVTGNWPLIFIVTFGSFWFGWLGILCGMPQHIGMQPDVPDFRRCCRTFTCSWLPGFLYWNMQYHIEHHMYPGVPFYNLPKLRQAMIAELPPAPHGLWATWREIIAILQKQKQDPDYCYMAPLPESHGENVDDSILEAEAAKTA